MENIRCRWCGENELLIAYHDDEWCARQLHDERGLFEFLTLEMMQCGLSWLTVLKKREAMRSAFDNFDPNVIAGYDEAKIYSLMTYPGIIRSRRKLEAMAHNARCFLRLQREEGSFDKWIWDFTDGKTIVNPESRQNMPAGTPLSEKISASLKSRGFKFMGPVVVYSFMQAIGMADDHEESCFMAGKIDKNLILNINKY